MRVASNPKVVHIPQQTSIGFEVVVPTESDAKDLTRFLDHTRMGRGRARTQPAYTLKAVELKWVPGGRTMPLLPEFVEAVEAWARKKRYGMARDVRELRSGMEELQSSRSKKVATRYVAAVEGSLHPLLAQAHGLLSDMKDWLGGFNVALRRAQQESKDLPGKLVWQDQIVEFLKDYDNGYSDQLRSIAYDIEGVWANKSTPNQVQDSALKALRALSEPRGKANISSALNSFKFMPHPKLGEHIAYDVSDLETWESAFGAWLSQGQKILRDQLNRSKSTLS